MADTHEWTFNRRFKVVSDRNGCFNTDTGELRFTDWGDKSKPPTKWRSTFGWNHGHGGIMYERDCVINTRGMMYRHFARKVPEDKEGQMEITNLRMFGVIVNTDNFQEMLQDNNVSFCDTHGEAISELVIASLGMHEYHKTCQEGGYDLTLQTHTKQRLRRAKWDVLMMSGGLVKKLWDEAIVWTMKYLETAKYGKPARIVVDCSTENSLPRVDFANSFKTHSKNKTVTFGQVAVKYCLCSSHVDIGAVYDEACNNGYRVMILNNSDDAILAFHDGKGNRHYYNVDISTNDSSHTLWTHKLYAMMSCMTEEQEENLLTLIMSPFTVYNPTNRKEKVIFKSVTGYLPSGVGDTTTCNNCIYYILAYSLHLLLEQGHEMSIELLTLAGFNFGFRFSYEKCETYSFQFLKNSPIILDNGSFLSMPNLGVLLRLSGTYEGDVPVLPKKHCPPWATCKYAYCQSLLTFGFFKYFLYEPLLVLCPYFHHLTSEEHYVHSSFMETIGDTHKRIVLSRKQFYSRYRDVITDTQIDVFETLMQQAGFGTLVYCELIDIVMKFDYGLKF